MKRAFFEYAAIVCALLVTVTLAYTVVSFLTNRTDFELIFGNTVQIRGANGRLTFCDALENGITIDSWGLPRSDTPVLSDIGQSVWGFGFRHVTFADGTTVWYLRLPLLIPFVILIVLSGLCFNRVRKMRHIAAKQRQP